MSNIILALLKVPWQTKGLILVDGIVKRGQALPNKILIILKMP